MPIMGTKSAVRIVQPRKMSLKHGFQICVISILASAVFELSAILWFFNKSKLEIISGTYAATWQLFYANCVIGWFILALVVYPRAYTIKYFDDWYNQKWSMYFTCFISPSLRLVMTVSDAHNCEVTHWRLKHHHLQA